MASPQKYECTKCGYKFVPKTKVPERCPYCSNFTVRKVATAQELISSATKRNFDF